MTLTDDLHRLARLAERLMPDRRDPERFHEQKSDLAAALGALARSAAGRSPANHRKELN
jgi:hypothetical protein